MNTRPTLADALSDEQLEEILSAVTQRMEEKQRKADKAARRGAPSSPRSTLSVWMMTAKPGDAIYTTYSPSHAYNVATQYGAHIRSEACVLIRGTFAAPMVEKLLRVERLADDAASPEA